MEKDIYKNEDKYCYKCGARLLKTKIGAEKVREYSPFGSCYSYSAFNSRTGERQYGMKFYCPNCRWWNNHTNYSVFKI